MALVVGIMRTNQLKWLRFKPAVSQGKCSNKLAAAHIHRPSINNLLSIHKVTTTTTLQQQRVWHARSACCLQFAHVARRVAWPAPGGGNRV